MRTIKWLSPTAIMQWDADRDEFFRQRLADTPPGKYAQTPAMAVGSAFDACIKSYLHQAVYGNYGPGDVFKFETIFETQVEPQNRDAARVAGLRVFSEYLKCGACADLVFRIKDRAPSFEFELKSVITAPVGGSVMAVPFRGKPDLWYEAVVGSYRRVAGGPDKASPVLRTVLDFKVNGMMSPRLTSPTAGYRLCRGTSDPMKVHKDYVADISIESIDSMWALQLCIYTWLVNVDPATGELPTGMMSRSISCSIEQLTGPLDRVRVASFDAVITPALQERIYGKAASIWWRLERGTREIFSDRMSQDESEERCALLNGTGETVIRLPESTSGAEGGSGSQADWLFGRL